MRVVTHYEVLGVGPDASPEEIQQAWRERVKRFHPDAHPNAPAAMRERLTRQVAEVNAAYEVLRDPVTRAAYDRSLREREARRGGAAPAAGPLGWRQPEPDECWICGARPAAQVRFRQESGRLLWSVRRWIDGPFCQTCGTAIFRELTNRTLITGWWGILSFFLNLATIVRNLVAYRAIRRLAWPRPNPGNVLSLLPLPLDPGRPLHKRAGVWVAPFAAVVAGGLIGGAVGDAGQRSARELPHVGSCVDFADEQAVPCSGPHDGYVIAVTDSRLDCPVAADFSAERADGRIVCIVAGSAPEGGG